MESNHGDVGGAGRGLGMDKFERTRGGLDPEALDTVSILTGDQ